MGINEIKCKLLCAGFEHSSFWSQTPSPTPIRIKTISLTPIWIKMKPFKNISSKLHFYWVITFSEWDVLVLLDKKLSILGDIFDKDTHNSLYTSMDLYLVIILSSGNAVLCKCCWQKVAAFWSIFETMDTQKFGEWLPF